MTTKAIHPYWGKRWVQALRTTDAPQITGKLHENGALCSVGVLYNEMIQDGLMPAWDDPEGWIDAGMALERTLALAAPVIVRERVAYLNDHVGYSFADIAAWIECIMGLDADPAPVPDATPVSEERVVAAEVA